MKRNFTCIVCPNGCEISAEYTEAGEILKISGESCGKGKEYVTQELKNPQRTIATSVPVKNGELPLASVRLTKPVSRERIPDVMKEIKKIYLEAPVRAGDVIIPHILGFDSDVIITKSVREKEA
jgi:CxxC motif-containing protein